MKEFKLARPLPWPPSMVYDRIMDISSYRDVYPMVKSTAVQKEQRSYRDVEIDFNLASGALIKDPSLGVRITGQRPHQIQVEQTKGQFEAMSMKWRLEPSPEGGTDLQFSMTYKTGWGVGADIVASAIVKRIVGDTLTRFEAHMAEFMKQQVVEEPLVRHRKRWVPA